MYVAATCPLILCSVCFQDFVDMKVVVSVRCGECAAGGGKEGGVGCLKEMSVTALRTTVTITDTGELAVQYDALNQICCSILMDAVNFLPLTALFRCTRQLYPRKVYTNKEFKLLFTTDCIEKRDLAINTSHCFI